MNLSPLLVSSRPPERQTGRHRGANLQSQSLIELPKPETVVGHALEEPTTKEELGTQSVTDTTGHDAAAAETAHTSEGVTGEVLSPALSQAELQLDEDRDREAPKLKTKLSSFGRLRLHMKETFSRKNNCSTPNEEDPVCADANREEGAKSAPINGETIKTDSYDVGEGRSYSLEDLVFSSVNPPLPSKRTNKMRNMSDTKSLLRIFRKNLN
ncbi:uncharacterized protein [Ambystoma mexicanum]|uniref:uncharacterized protein n=1 Tax=Ambystoma mexicanum TaxID=8296 RepID=UPI0037E83D41